MDKSYRIKANIGADQVLNVNLRQDIDLYEILSLKLSQEKIYDSHSADYGVIVGRVLANDAFGVPNARVSVFIPINESDELKPSINSIYPFKSVTDYNSNNIRYNLLPSNKEFACHANVGTFPSKRLVLDDDSILEIYDKYYRYTTLTNNSGDYMIFGVPVGQQTIHVDVDLSDIGILSQTPRDMIFKGYNRNMFDSPTKFKESTNLEELPQIYSENSSVDVYPFWGDESLRDIAITRKDISLQYKFEPTCVFMGSVITDNGENAIGHNCVPGEYVGDASQLVTTEGTIEMIRKTIDDKVEEFPIKGNNLIDESGVFCYQIPMNLDYVGMDEYGNIVPTDNPSKGIPTRARVRFRITLKESGDIELTNHTARYLIPNNPPLVKSMLKPMVNDNIIDSDLMYEFGTLTPDICFRDLYWNKVYSVKGYIPRLQASRYEKTREYIGLKGVNKKGARGNNLIPFNKINLNFSVSATNLLHELYNGIPNRLKRYWRLLSSKTIGVDIDGALENIIDETDAVGLDFYNDWLNGCLYFPSWNWRIRMKKKYKEGDEVYESEMCECSGEKSEKIETLFLYNNCSLIYEDADLHFIDLEYDTTPTLYTWDDMNIYIENPPNPSSRNAEDSAVINTYFNGAKHSMSLGSKTFFSGVIKKITNKDGGDLYYYSFGNSLTNEKSSVASEKSGLCYDYARLFSTDIILLGSLNDCDIDGVPKMPYTYPATTATIPPVGRVKPNVTEPDGGFDGNDDMERNLFYQNGMNWGRMWKMYDEVGFTDDGRPIEEDASKPKETGITSTYNTGLFFGMKPRTRFLSWLYINVLSIKDFITYSAPKTCFNVERLCELGVINDLYEKEDGEIDGITFKHLHDIGTTGVITKRCIVDNGTRALFATLNNNTLIAQKENETTGYKTYDLIYFYPTNFDGRLNDFCKNNFKTKNGDSFLKDTINKDYIDFRLGNTSQYTIINTRRSGFGSGRVLSSAAGSTSTYSNGNSIWGGARKPVSSSTRDDSEIFFSYVNEAKMPHFYGFKLGDDIAYPAKANYFNSLFSKDKRIKPKKTFDYVFPLYDNSFYFYFGLRKGNTAIDRFYSEFYGECPTKKSYAFSLTIDSVIPSKACEKNGGEVTYVLEEVEFPCNVELIKDGEVIKEETVNLMTNTFTGISNGRYILRATNNKGKVIEVDAVLEPYNISLEWEVVNNIRTEYSSTKDCISICCNDYYGELEFKNVIADGIKYDVTSLIKVANGIYNLQTDSDIIARIKISPRLEGVDFESTLCDSCDCNASDNNIFRINRPVTYDVEVIQMCKNGAEFVESDVNNFYTISITDITLPELYVNNVPLKFMVGIDEDEISRYNDKFHKSGITTSVTDTNISGWFGVHMPDTYSSLFQKPLENIEAWYKHVVERNGMDVLEAKFTYMFNLSKAAYVTTENKNYFNVRFENGGSSLSLLRSGLPVYTDFNENSTEKAGEFNSFLTSKVDSITANTASPNIVSDNYRYVNDATLYPEETKTITKDFDFNPKYKDAVNTAGNYFAGFTDNASILDMSDGCTEKIEVYKSIPVKSHDLYRDGVKKCPSVEYKELEEKIYTPVTTRPTYPFLRTEFIDRRFDFDMFYVTPFDAKEEQIWSKGKISALTYNGIEMLYDAKKNIIGDGLEYSYNVSDMSITYNSDEPKRFYSSTLEYASGLGSTIDLREGYRYNKRPNPSANGLIPVVTDTDVNDVVNFGLDDTTVVGYPAKRRLCFYNIPYGDYYKFTNVSCSYNNINLDKKTTSFAAQVVPGETVSYSIETKSLVELQLNDFENDYSNNHYNILYTWCIDGDCSINEKEKLNQDGDNIRLVCASNKINDLKFKIISTGTTNFDSKIEYDESKNKLGVRLMGDKIVNGQHENLFKIKTASSMTDVIATVTGNTMGSILSLPDPNPLDTDTRFKEYVFDGSNRPINGNRFINVLFDRYYYSTYADSLMKKLRALNASTIYDAGKFDLTYEGHEYITKDMDVEVDGDTIVVNVSVTGEIPTHAEETTTRMDSEGSGTGSQNATGSGKNYYDCLTFSISTNPNDVSYIDFEDIERYCFKIDFKGNIGTYTESNTVSVNGNDKKTIKIVLKQNEALFKDGIGEKATIKLFIKTKSALVYYLEFKMQVMEATEDNKIKLKILKD